MDKQDKRSCTTCAKAKAKCVKRAGVHNCERCARLNKECQWKEPVQRRRRTNKTTRTAQLEKLESKIEHLVNALSTQQHQPIDRQLSTFDSQISKPPLTQAHEVNIGLCCEHDDDPETTLPTGDRPTISPEECEILLDRYRRLMSTGMPFIVVPNVSAVSLSKQKPVVVRTICTVALFHDLPRQQKLVVDLHREIAERMFVKNEKSLDLLQAILILVGWYHPHIFFSPQTTNLLHLAIALTIDLGIDRAPAHCADFKQATSKTVHGPNPVQKLPTLEERRALLCVFYQTNMLSSSFRKMDTMPFTPYMEQCLISLERAQEYSADSSLVQNVRIQRVMEQIQTTDISNTPARVYVRAFQADLERSRRMEDDENVFLRMQHVAAEIIMWELSVSELLETQSATTQRLEDLYHCVTAIKFFFDVFFAIPVSTYHLLPFTVFGQFAHVFMCLTKIASLEIDRWNLHALNEQLDFLEVMEECAGRFESAARGIVDGLEMRNETFGKWASKVRWMKSKFVKEIEQQQPTPPDDFPAEFFGYLDDNFWEGFGEIEGLLLNGGAA